MKNLSLSEYLNSPCRASSVPYWKARNIDIPDNMLIVHNDCYVKSEFSNYIDEPYFRLYHDLKSINIQNIDGINIVVATADMLELLVDTINASYCDLSVTKEQLESYRKTRVYCSDLWILLKDTSTGIFVGSGIADYDQETHELIIEWVQVLPQYRGRGLGQLIVNNLLSKKQGVAKFATVSGKIDNKTNPESLYRKCGFTGNDVWHVLHKKLCK